MKLNKTFGRIATTLVATAMLASMAVVPAFAADYTAQGTKGKKLESFKINKTLVLPADVDLPTNEQFTFDIVPVTEGELGNITTDTGMDKSYDIEYGIGDTLNNAGSATVTGAEPLMESTRVEGAKEITIDATFNTLPTGFTEPGIYKYQIKEDNAGTEYVDMTKALDLYVLVERGDFDEISDNAETCEVTGVVVYPADTTPNNKDSKEDTYVNFYRIDSTGKDLVGDVIVKKTVAGAMGSKSETFTFTVKGLTVGTDYTYYIDTEKQENPLTSSANTFTIHDGQTVKITGIADDLVLEIAETDGKANIGYTLTNVTVNNNPWTDGEGGNKNGEGNGVNITVDKDNDQSVEFTNTRDAVSPTGLVMDIAPYALLVVVAAAGCFVFLRKRRED